MVDLSDLIVFDHLNSKVHAMNLRADLWVLPFLNLYAMGNWAIQSQTSVSISEPFSFDAGASQSGYGGGFGLTAAAGAWGFFGTIDLNWTWNKLQKLDQPVGTFLLTPRIGKNFGKLGGVEWIFWVGAMRQVIEAGTRGEIRLSDAVGGGGNADGSFQQDLRAWYDALPPGRQAVVGGLVSRIQGNDPVVHYDLDKAVAYPWNVLIGTEIGLTPAWRIRAEVGFIQRTQVIIGLNYRFGGFVRGPGYRPMKPRIRPNPFGLAVPSRFGCQRQDAWPRLGCARDGSPWRDSARRSAASAAVGLRRAVGTAAPSSR